MLALALAFVAPLHGWVAKSQSIYGAQIQEIQDLMNGLPVARVPQAQLGYLWHSPEHVNDTRGLGGGITYAFNPALCALLEPVFQEDIIGWNTFVNCRDFHSAIARAFDKYAAREPHCTARAIRSTHVHHARRPWGCAFPALARFPRPIL